MLLSGSLPRVLDTEEIFRRSGGEFWEGELHE